MYVLLQKQIPDGAKINSAMRRNSKRFSYSHIIKSILILMNQRNRGMHV